MPTPEGRVKARVRQVLSEYGSQLYSYWPVPSGFGRTTVDVLGCYRGYFFAIEVKARGKKPTLRQTQVLGSMESAMGKTFIVDRIDSPVIDDLRQWLDTLGATINDDPHITPDKTRRRAVV